MLLASDQEEELGSCFSLRYTFFAFSSLELQHLNSPASPSKADVHSSARNRNLGQHTFHFDSL